MAKQKIEIEVSKESLELAEGIKQMVLSAKEALKDGWQPGQDIPAIAASAFAALLPAVQGISQVPDEIKEDPAAFAKALACPMADMVADLLKKEEE